MTIIRNLDAYGAHYASGSQMLRVFGVALTIGFLNASLPDAGRFGTLLKQAVYVRAASTSGAGQRVYNA